MNRKGKYIMKNLKPLLKVEYGEKFLLKKTNTNNNLLLNNPFILEEDGLFDNSLTKRDDIIIEIMKGNLIKEDFFIPKQNELYYFLNENLKIKSKTNRNNLFDILNLSIHNVYKTEEEIKEENISNFKEVLNKLKIINTDSDQSDLNLYKIKELLDYSDKGLLQKLSTKK